MSLRRWPRTLSVPLRAALKALGLEAPTEVQTEAIPAGLTRRHVLLASETGSGKTLGYLLPLAHKLKQDEAREQQGSGAVEPRRIPRALIVTPTRELSRQVLSVCKSLAHFAKFRSALLLPTREAPPGTDVAVAPPPPTLDTPWVRADASQRLDYLVFDEADTLLRMQHRRQAPPLPATLFGGAQLFFVAATVTRQTVHEAEQLARQVDASRLPMQVVRTARLHQPPADVRVRWMQVHRAPDRVPRLLECLRATADDEPATMIFCNSIDACRFVQHTLAEHGWDSAACHGGLPPPRRRLEFERFVSGTTSRMVCTDVAARGLDLRFLRRVICFDAPRSLSEYLHRIGRLRDGGECVVLLRPAARDQALAESVRQQRRVGERARQVATR